ncbi:MAG: aromatic ring-hydroxylating dioxygenase subunit alpha [Oscillatoria sp. PMC 1068.18]|nr:aromatic ring-hydroxylating dioxygenase subunit alpha [Oscillatoria sp. PMC 1076.18]MEC4988750.1 aromatic ring-hydroxylating dioxygenase subunit alpha [Oscillatoria sp. PMC 1068.18]
MSCIDPILLNDWYIVGKAEDIQPGTIKPVRLLGEDIVVWRGSSLESPVLAWQDWCPHRGVPLSLGKIVGDRLACRYHGWQYDKTGQCVCVPSLPTQSPPVNAHVKTYKCQESSGYIWANLGDFPRQLPAFPNNPDHRQFVAEPYYISSSPFRVMENNLDMSHPAFLHEGTIGDPNFPLVEDYEVNAEKDRIVIRNIQSWQVGANYTNIKTLSKINISSLIINYPLSMTAVKEIEDSNEKIYVFINITPIEEEKSVMWISFAMNYGHEIAESEMQTYTDKVFREDVFILESQRPARLPLLYQKDTDPQWPPEVHVRCDKASVVYRRWLKSLGITFGVC